MKVQGTRPVAVGEAWREARPAVAGSFARILEEELSRTELRFSQHALARLQGREIALTPADLERLKGAVALAAAKGAKESLVLMDDLALVVSITNRTVITALKGAEKKERVFTNIDSAVIV